MMVVFILMDVKNRHITIHIYIWYTSIANTAMVNLVFNSMMIKIEKNRCGICGKMVNMLDYGAEFSLPSGQ